MGELAGAELRHDLAHRPGRRLDRPGAGVTAEGPVANAVGSGVVERDRRDGLALDVFPDIELGPVEQGMNADMSPRCEIRLVLIPEFRRLLADIPGALLVPGREVALLGATPLLVRPEPDDDAGERLGVSVGRSEEHTSELQSQSNLV